MRYITEIVDSILSLCEYYRPFVVFCVAATMYTLTIGHLQLSVLRLHFTVWTTGYL